LKNLGGLYAALITPFHENGEVNYEQIQNVVEFLIQKGIDGFYVCGSTGEAFLLTMEERKKILETVIAKNRGRVSVIAHVGNIGTDLSVELGKHAKAAGADAISSVTPFYYKFSEKEIINYYYALADRTQMPTIVYNFPSLTGFALSIKDVDELAKNPNIVGIKHTSLDLYALERFKKAHPRLTVFNGHDEVLLYGLIAGADGGIGSTYNFMPHKFRKLRQFVLQGKIKEAQNVQHEINDVIDYVSKYGAMRVAKEFLRDWGFDCGNCRAPFTPLTDAEKAELKTVFIKKVRE
jgi:N-acetylneuraminate lyase